MESKREHYVKLGVIGIYLVILGLMYLFMTVQGLSFRDLAHLIQSVIHRSGAWGPVIMTGVYAVSTIVPFPTTGFAIVSGALFGPWLGLLIAVFGVNLTAWISFGLARYFGQHFVQEKEKGWVKELDHLLTEEGFVPVMLMRLLFVPSDFVSLGSGLTRMPFKTFMMATFVGTLPATLAFTLLGEAVLNPAGKVVLASLAVALVATVLVLRRVPALKKYIPK